MGEEERGRAVAAGLAMLLVLHGAERYAEDIAFLAACYRYLRGARTMAPWLRAGRREG
ncbi:MAG TPA: hypothetical protein VFL91_29835 [Thermomicrobiales bacterium]|nr:hypothetical protein [Thermomicrobiales bacterium]